MIADNVKMVCVSEECMYVCSASETAGSEAPYGHDATAFFWQVAADKKNGKVDCLLLARSLLELALADDDADDNDDDDEENDDGDDG